MHDCMLVCAALQRVFDMYDATNVNAVIPKILAEYPSANYADGWARASDLLTHYFFSCGTRRSARAVDASKGNIWL